MRQETESRFSYACGCGHLAHGADVPEVLGNAQAHALAVHGALVPDRVVLEQLAADDPGMGSAGRSREG